MPRKGKSRQTESRFPSCQGLKGGGNEKRLLMVKGVSFWGDENVRVRWWWWHKLVKVLNDTKFTVSKGDFYGMLIISQYKIILKCKVPVFPWWLSAILASPIPFPLRLLPAPPLPTPFSPAPSLLPSPLLPTLPFPLLPTLPFPSPPHPSLPLPPEAHQVLRSTARPLAHACCPDRRATSARTPAVLT